MGDGENIQAEVDDLREKIAEKNLPKEVEEKALKEVKRLSQNAFNQAETGVIRRYVHWILILPWTESKDEAVDLEYARKVLNEDHYGLT
ncbi:MAG: endopeptidase La, partial [Ezakiella sp.]